jgi:hypothetical protein
VLKDGAIGLAAALSQLPKLERLSICSVQCSDHSTLRFPTEILPKLQQLTCLELVRVGMMQHGGRERSKTALQPLQHLTGLVEFKIGASYSYIYRCDITASMLSGMSGLTRLHIAAQPFEPNALAGLPQLQHLALQMCSLLPGPSGGLALHQLLSQIPALQELIYLDLDSSCQWYLPGSCWQQHLCRSCQLDSTCMWGMDLLQPPMQHSQPAASCSTSASGTTPCCPMLTWQYIFPTGWQLPHLRSLDIDGISPDGCNFAAAPDGSCLVGCCPSLQSFSAAHIQCSTELLGPLQELSSLQTLHAGAQL